MNKKFILVWASEDLSEVQIKKDPIQIPLNILNFGISSLILVRKNRLKCLGKYKIKIIERNKVLLKFKDFRDISYVLMLGTSPVNIIYAILIKLINPKSKIIWKLDSDGNNVHPLVAIIMLLISRVYFKICNY